MGHSNSSDSLGSTHRLARSTSSVESTIQVLAASLADETRSDTPKPLGCFDRNAIFGAGNKTGRLSEEYDLSGERKLGHGAFGWVERCYHRPTGQTRAVKRIAKRQVVNASFLRQELMVMRVLDHPNIVRLHEVFEDSRYLHLCMELCDGGELAACVARSGQFSEAGAAHVMKQLVGAVHYMHGKHYIGHRDLKPENCVFAGNDTDWTWEQSQLKLIDFGTAAWCRPGEVFTEVVGTLAYAAPEVWGDSYDLKCDVWSLGIILHELLSGRLPVSCEITCRGAAWKGVSNDAKELVRGLTARNPDARWSLNYCLQQPWLVRRAPAAGEESLLHPDVVRNMSRYARGTMLRKAALQAIAMQMNEGQMKDLEDMFRLLDKNGDGVLSLQEVQEGIAGSSAGCQLEWLFKELDTNGDGELQYTEFLAAALSAHRYLQHDLAWSAFKKFDLSDAGAISSTDLRNVFGSSNILRSQSMETEQMEALVAAADRNCDGHVSFEEFVQMLQDSQTSSQGDVPILQAAAKLPETQQTVVKKRPALNNSNSCDSEGLQKGPVLKRPALKRPAVAESVAKKHASFYASCGVRN